MGLTRIERLRREAARATIVADATADIAELDDGSIEPEAIFTRLLDSAGARTDNRIEVLTLQSLRAYQRDGMGGLARYLATADIPDDLRTPETVQAIKRAILG